jgi:hypothetical protein
MVNKHFFLKPIIALVFLIFSTSCFATVYQWSVEVKSMISSETNAHPQAFLWIPENCRQVRGVILGQHNMTEELIFENPVFRKELSKLGFAEIWVTPAFDMVFDFSKDAGAKVDEIMKSLAEVSGYGELEFAPIVPIGHSACASYPWNFAVWNPELTLAVLSIHGDAPLTNLTGSGRPNPDWGQRKIDGVPGLMVEGEYEWWEDRVQPALNFQMKYPGAAISFFCDAGYGHFDISDNLIQYLCKFLQKAAKNRLPAEMPLNKPSKLIPVNPQNGWLGERWHKDRKPQFTSAPYAQYKGGRKDAFWYFDKEMANLTEKYYAMARGKKEQYISITQNGKLLQVNTKHHARFVLNFEPESDGVTFHLNAVYTDSLRTKLTDQHASSKISISRICGPVEKVNDTTFILKYYRMGLNNPRRTDDIWLMATSKGDKDYKSTVQQMTLHLPHQNTDGKAQKISFDSLSNIKNGAKSLILNAKSDAGLPVYYYVKEGPAEIVDGKLVFTKIPPRAKFPVKVTIVAWQYGRATEPKVKTAEAVERSFYITKQGLFVK